MSFALSKLNPKSTYNVIHDELEMSLKLTANYMDLTFWVCKNL